MASVSLQQIVKHYDKTPVLHGIDLDIADGELMVFVGPSGCGKSTLLRMIAGLETISSGTLQIGGVRANDIAPAQRQLAMVFQSYALYPHMTVYDNMAFSLKLAGQRSDVIDAAVQRAATTLQISALLQRKPSELSGGQRQRVAIGRAIVRTPQLFLFDEPLSNLDASLRVQMRVEISRLHRELATTMIYVTHDQVEAMTLGQRIAVFNAGRIEQVGTPHQLYNHPANLFVAGFLGTPKMNFISAEVLASQGAQLKLLLPGGAMVTVAAGAASCGERVTLGVRAEHLRIAPAPGSNTVEVQIGHIEYLGDQAIVYASLAGSSELIAIRTPADASALQTGQRCQLQLPLQQCHVFDRSGQSLALSAAHA